MAEFDFSSENPLNSFNLDKFLSTILNPICCLGINFENESGIIANWRPVNVNHRLTNRPIRTSAFVLDQNSVVRGEQIVFENETCYRLKVMDQIEAKIDILQRGFYVRFQEICGRCTEEAMRFDKKGKT